MNDSERKLEVGIVPWHFLEPHAQRDAVILVSSKLAIEAVARKVAEDDNEAVQAWVATGEISKPTLEQLELWRSNPVTIEFSCAIVQPFVLMQEL